MAKQKQDRRGQRGIPGPPGPRGFAGATGHSGARGATGATGGKGATGATGGKGATGARGAKGDRTPIHGGKGRQRLLLSLERHIENIYGELTVQMQRLGRIQAQVDELRSKIRQV